MRESNHVQFLHLVFALSCLLALCLILNVEVGASSATVASDFQFHLQVTPTPLPEAHWIMADGDVVNDWEIYRSVIDISGIVPDGRIIWAASNGGLLRWERDTGNLTQYLAPRFPLPSNNLSQVLLHEGELYISGYGGLALFDRQDTWALYTGEDTGLTMGHFVPMAMVDDVLWIGGEDGLAQLFPDGHWETVRAGENTFPSNNIHKIVPRDDGVYVVVALGPTVHDERQVMRFANGVWEIVDRPLMVYFETPDGSLWKGENHTLFKSTDQGLTWKRILETDRYIQPRAFDTQGRVYASKDDTIYVLEKDQVEETYRFAEIGPELNFINIIEWDESGRLWIATDGRGLTMFDGERWHNWQPETSEIRDDAIRGLAISNGKLYAGTFGSAGSGGVNVFDIEAERWTNFWPGESPLSGGGVGGIAIDSQGRVYFPTAVGILDIYDGENWEHIPMPLPAGYILTTSEGLFDEDGNYWVGAGGRGLWKYNGSEWFVYDVPGHVNALAFDQDGRLWVGTSTGLVVRDLSKNWHLYTTEELPLGNGWVQDVTVDADGRVWIISANSLVMFNGQEYQSFPSEIVGATLWGDALAFDLQGNLWMEAGWGLACFRGTPEIPPFTELKLSPNRTIPEGKLLHELGSVVPRSTAIVTIVGMLAVLGLCLTVLLVAAGVGLFFLLRPKRS